MTFAEMMALIIAFIGGGGLVGFVSLIYKRGEKSGTLSSKIQELDRSIVDHNSRLTYIERLFMNNAPIVAKSVRKSLNEQPDGQKDEVK